MKYFNLQSHTWGRGLLRRRNTTVHCFKITSRVMLVWERKDKS